MSSYTKYPRTYHLPWSPGTTSDDRILSSVEHFVGQEVVVTEKMDGENTSMYRDEIHARSMDSARHPSQTWVRGLHGRICTDIPEGWRFCGENLYAKHSIHYEALFSYFMLFSVWNDRNEALSWDETCEWAELLDIATVPVLWRGVWDEEMICRCMPAEVLLEDDDPMEGYVVRLAAGFHYDRFDRSVAKYVRKGHVSSTVHWRTAPVEPNLLWTK